MRKVYLQSNLHGVKEKKTKSKKVEAIPKQDEGCYLVVVQGSQHPPTLFHDTYDEAFKEAIRLSTKENKRAYVVKTVAMVELVPNITKYN